MQLVQPSDKLAQKGSSKIRMMGSAQDLMTGLALLGT
jgi:hypothetical protein